MKRLPTLPTPRGPRFVRHSGTAMLARQLPLLRSDTAERAASIVVALETLTTLTALTLIDAEALGSGEGASIGRGIRVVIASGFDDRFFAQAVRQGILPVQLPRETLETIAAQVEAHPDQMIEVDLERQTIDLPGVASLSFEPSPRIRRRLLHGLDDLDELTEHREVAAAFRTEDARRRPWLYDA